MIAPHVGGGFGGKAGHARRAHRGDRRGPARSAGPVTWVETRSENLVSMPHGRGQVGLLRAGPHPRRHDHRAAGAGGRRLRRLRRVRRRRWRIGPTYTMSQGVYRHPEARLRRPPSRSPTPRRWARSAAPAARRPTAHLERMMDLAADELGIDPVEIRRRNFLDPATFPLTTLTGARYDVGDYDLPLREALRLADYDEAPRGAGRRAARPATRCSSASASASTSRSPRRRGQRVRLGHRARRRHRPPSRRAPPAHGQGHATAFAMLVQRPARHPDRDDPVRAVRHRHGAARRRAPAGRGRCRWAATPCRRRPTTCWSRPGRRAARAAGGGRRRRRAHRRRRVRRGRRARR